MSERLTDEQIEIIWRAADRSREDQAYFRSDVFNLISNLQHYKQLAEERGKEIEWLRDKNESLESTLQHYRGYQ